MSRKLSQNLRGTIEFKEKYKCPKCSWGTCDIGEIRASGGFMSSILELESKKFTSVTCERCSYTEFYKRDPSFLDGMLDFFVS